MFIPTQEQFKIIIIKIKKFLENYRKKEVDKNLNTLFLSDGTILNYYMKPECLADLLGIKIDNLKEMGLIYSNEPLKQLEELIDNSAVIYETILKKNSVYNFFFTKYFSSSIFALTQIQNNPVDKIDFVSQYDGQSKSNGSSLDINYCVGFSEKDNAIFLGLKKNSDNLYIPCFLISTNSVRYCQQMFHIILEKQRVMIASGIIYQPNKRYDLSLSKAQQKVQKLKELTKEHDGYLILTKDYLYATGSVTKLSNREHAVNDTLRILINDMKNGVSFNSLVPEDLEIIKELIETYNQTVELGRQRVIISPEQK